MRVYIPLTLPALRAAHGAGELAPESGSLVAYAVTPGLRERQVSDDTEELEYAALSGAALASLRLLAAEPEAVRRRVVLAVDAADGAVAPGPEGRVTLGEVRVAAPVALSRAAAVHVDAADAGEEVSAALAELREFDAAEGEEEPEGPELLWYGVQEIPSLLD